MNGAEPVGPATLASFAARFSCCGLAAQTLLPVYGLAESSVGLAFPALGHAPEVEHILAEPFFSEGRALPAPAYDPVTIAMVCCGHALPGHQIRIVDETEHELPERRVGRLEFRGPSATSGYFRNLQASAALFHGTWLDSGDYAYMAHGQVFITGRIKDLIKRGGRSFYPHGLEQAAGTLPCIRKGGVAAFGSADPVSGTERLIIVAETGVHEEQLRARLRHSINQLALDVIGMPPDDIVLVAPHSILKTSSGKIRRVACRQAYENGLLGKLEMPVFMHYVRYGAQSVRARCRLALRTLGTGLYPLYAWLVFSVLALFFGTLIAQRQ